jgi:hypothetical protein
MSAPLTHEGTQARPSAPLAVRNAARVMYAGAVASVILIVVEFVTAGATKTALGRRYPRLSASELTTVTHFTVISEAVVALIAAVLFVWIARTCMDGKNWARITATVLCGLGILEAFLALTVPHLRAGRSSADLIVSFVVAGIGLVSICILWQRSPNAYFRQLSDPRV